MSMPIIEVQKLSSTGKGYSWLASVVVCLCCGIACLFLVISVPIYGEMFGALQVDLPLATRMLLATNSWLLPLVFIGLVALAFGKEFFIHDTKRSLLASLWISIAVIALVGLVEFILYLPLLELTRKLTNAK